MQDCVLSYGFVIKEASFIYDNVSILKCVSQVVRCEVPPSSELRGFFPREDAAKSLPQALKHRPPLHSSHAFKRSSTVL
ncbi:hypothetical protein Taro_040018 [Colocasia esculenta]|uniref:Uncharacterized protein n=1 Tax=Colocasia esculenta TaxID=4460 RepID=A0A843WC21_COLES|nr:hypothetical protein [Colocasia esculenta]